jgi:hypothetical protein
MSEVQHHAMLTPAACDSWTQQVLACQAQWTRRHPDVPFYTLGMAAYLDCKSSAQAAPGAALYRQRILRDASNAMLMAQFEPLYQSLCQCIARLYGMPATLASEHAALPGFHIHLPHPSFAGDVASIHRDLQFQQVFPNESLQPEQVITFTLPISLPPGAGLYLWQQEVKTFHPYAQGQLVIHSGLCTHQAVLRCAGDVPPRIAFQGHGVLRDNGIALYW